MAIVDNNSNNVNNVLQRPTLQRHRSGTGTGSSSSSRRSMRWLQQKSSSMRSIKSFFSSSSEGSSSQEEEPTASPTRTKATTSHKRSRMPNRARTFGEGGSPTTKQSRIPNRSRSIGESGSSTSSRSKRHLFSKSRQHEEVTSLDKDLQAMEEFLNKVKDNPDMSHLLSEHLNAKSHTRPSIPRRSKSDKRIPKRSKSCRA